MPSQTIAEKQKKADIIQKFQGAEASGKNTGSPEVQVALITTRIVELTDHLKSHKKDFSTQRGLLKLVGQRRKMLEYLKAKDVARYAKLINDLDLRK